MKIRKEDFMNNYYSKIIIEISALVFYIYEIYTFVSGPPEHSVAIAILKFIMLFLALPLLYIFRIAEFFDWGGALSFFISGVFKTDSHANNFIQVKLFYYATYTLLTILLIFETGKFVLELVRQYLGF